MFLTHLDCLNLAHWLHNTVSEDALSPVCFAIVDSSGDLIWFERMDQAPVQSITLAISKAYSAARLGIATTEFHLQLQQDHLQTQDYMDDQLTAVPGGTPLYSSDNRLIGAIGVSGRNSQSDQTLADAVAMYFQSI
ncbi:heme-binding protein [Paenalcaligenes hominis]|uniref:GlcG/HbpS family heme-binding protein n=1 Tax=Paenalcaligenes hominis TaxID=643674 RepID=UPI0035250EFD